MRTHHDQTLLHPDDSAEADIYHEQAQTYDLNQILTGTIVRVDNEEVVVDIGYKSEGVIVITEFSRPTDLGVGDVMIAEPNQLYGPHVAGRDPVPAQEPRCPARREAGVDQAGVATPVVLHDQHRVPEVAQREE